VNGLSGRHWKATVFFLSNNLLLTGHEYKEQDAPHVPVTAVGFAGLRQGPGGGRETIGLDGTSG